MRLFLVFSVGLLQACEAPPPPPGGTTSADYFPFDGQREWTYLSTDDGVSYRIFASMRSLEPDVIDGVNVYPVDYEIECVANDEACVDQVLRTVHWSSSEVHGVAIYAWTEGTSAMVEFDPPLVIADREMLRGDVITTETAGATWTSTLETFEECPDLISTDIGQCAKFVLDDGDGDNQTGVGLVGSYWAVPGFNVTGLELVGEEGQWQLWRSDCLPDEECDGQW